MSTSKRAMEKRQAKLAEEKRNRQLERKGLSTVNKKHSYGFKPLQQSTAYRRDTGSYQSVDNGRLNTFKKETTFYTGDVVKGIMETHKSNLVPVVEDQHVIDITRMRR